MKSLASTYGKKLIVDNSQAFFAKPIVGIDTFYSARKFFGVADGAYLYTDKKINVELEQDVSYERMSHLLKRVDIGAEAGYQDFRKNDDSLCKQEIKRMSKLTNSILSSIDYEMVSQKRIQNYTFLDETLRVSNLIHLDLDDEAVPMIYPYMTNDSSLKQKLIDNKIFVATYWPNVVDWAASNALEVEFANCLICIPIDQRCEKEDMRRILNIMTLL